MKISDDSDVTLPSLGSSLERSIVTLGVAGSLLSTTVKVAVPLFSSVVSPLMVPTEMPAVSSFRFVTETSSGSIAAYFGSALCA